MELTVRDTYRAQVRATIETGLLLGIKVAIVVLIVGLFAVGPLALAQDYLTTRQQARMGQAAADYLNKVLAEQQKAQGQPAPSPAK